MLKSTKNEVMELLSNVSFFSDCSRRELSQLASRVEQRRVDSGAALVRQGEPGDEFFVVAEGLAEATIDGRRVGSIHPGSFFGEMALLDQGPRVATVTASVPTRVLVLDARGFAAVVKDMPSVALKVMRGLAARLRAVEAGLGA